MDKKRLHLLIDPLLWDVFIQFCSQAKISYSQGVELVIREFLKSGSFRLNVPQKLSQVDYNDFKEDLENILTKIKNPEIKDGKK
jgi:hypothetical protein